MQYAIKCPFGPSVAEELISLDHKHHIDGPLCPASKGGQLYSPVYSASTLRRGIQGSHGMTEELELENNLYLP